MSTAGDGARDRDRPDAPVQIRCEDAAFVMTAAGTALIATHGLGILVPAAMIGRGLTAGPYLNAGNILLLGTALLLANCTVVGLGVALAYAGHRPPSSAWRTVVLALALLALAFMPVTILLSLATTVGVGIIGDVAAGALLVVVVSKLMPGEVRAQLDESGG